ncbi:efflux RND transporter periplasmic adaptor subunit [Saccharopolyspora phatthalungensis]|uniref:Multidrug efflux pump subunit AcrA (Membrane-fusion protein) n=1 Tax=Saccharopolyspora phatthalungensis TaxID=664693 RepID=A0A840Q8G5_9PSEU|nr:biotin/lipoyl-binding protein [Saccharopolyspora phatthalungensis]MBB5157024.1 multidrug efflux pump subunit AcrA (membrane-fusion protein) [Saccharopolyspora phatthalungensis]
MKHRLAVGRRWLIVVSVVVVIAAGVGTWLLTRTSSTPQVRTLAATTATLRQTISSSGTIEPAQQANLNFAVSGQVTAVNVAVGQHVSQGQALATVNSASLRASVADAQATVASDQARLSSDQSANASSTQLNADQAALSAAQNQLTNTQNSLHEATLTSPQDGTVALVNLTVGQQVSAGGSSSGSSTASSSAGGSSGSSSGDGNGSTAGGGQGGGGQGGGGQGGGGQGAGSGQNSSGSGNSSSTNAQIVVISDGSYIVNATVDDTEVSQVKIGNQAVITPNGSTTPVYGTVTSVGLLANSSSVPSYPVTIGITGSPSGLFPGAGAQVSIIVKQLSDVLTVPSGAIHYADGHQTVTVMANGQQSTVTVTTGMSSNGRTQILSGLSEGQQVVVPSTQPTNRPTTQTGGRGFGGGGGGFGGGGFGGGGRG